MDGVKEELEGRSGYMKQVLRERKAYEAMIDDLGPQVAAFEPLDMAEVSLFVTEVERRLSLLSDERMVLRGFPAWPDKRLEVLREAFHRHKEVLKLRESIDPEHDSWIPKSDVREELQHIMSKFEAAKPAVEWYLRSQDELSKNFRRNKIPFDFQHVHAAKEASVSLAKYSMRLVLEACPPDTLRDAPPMLLLQAEALLKTCYQFAFKCHQFAGGFDDAANALFASLHDALLLLMASEG